MSTEGGIDTMRLQSVISLAIMLRAFEIRTVGPHAIWDGFEFMNRMKYKVSDNVTP